MSVNTVHLAGNLVRDPELKVTGKGVSVVDFTIACNHYYTNKAGEKKEETAFVKCEAWDTGAETINQKLSKGDWVFVEGRLKEDRWEVQTDDGPKKRSRIVVRVSNFEVARKPRND